jgi:hypothetical protein
VKYQRIPELVDAEQVEQGRVPSLLSAAPPAAWYMPEDGLPRVLTDDGWFEVFESGDWLVKDGSGAFHRYTDRNFHLLFEEVPA